MRRIIALLLCLCLLLGGCAVTEPSPSTAAPTEPPKPTEPTELSSPPADVRVKTDYSQYAPRETLQPLYIPAESSCDHLQPSDDYGTIYPYVGGTAETQYGSSRYVYGIMDEKGQLLTDPVYSSVTLLQRWDDYWGTSEAVLPLWELEKIEVDADGGYSQRSAIAALNGSWVTDCCYTQVAVRDDYVLAVEQDWEAETFRFDLYSSTGELLLRSESLEILGQIPDPINYASYADGMFRLECYGDTDSSTWYTNPQGSLLLGPYGYGNDFSEGLAAVTEDYTNYYYIDKQGSTRFQRSFTSTEAFVDGVAVVSVDLQSQLIDRNGNILLQTRDDQYIYRERELYILVDDGVANYYNARGELIYADIPQGWSYLGHGLFSDWAEEIIHGETQRRFTVTRAEGAYHYAVPLWDEGIEVLAVYDYTDGLVKSYLLDKGAKLLMEGEGDFYAMQDTERSLLVESFGSGYRIYDEDLQYLFTCPRDAFPSVLLGDRVLCFSEQYSLCYSLEGELLFCYPLPGFGGD